MWSVCVVTLAELYSTWQIFQSLATRSFAMPGPESPLTIERDIFYKFIRMSGLWAQRLFQQFQGDMTTDSFKEGITYEKFMQANRKCYPAINHQAVHG